MSFDLSNDDREALRKSLGVAIAFGIFIMILGLAAIANPLYASLGVALIFGWIVLLCGIVQIVYAIQNRQTNRFWLKLLLGIFYLVAGVILIGNLFQSVLTLTLVLGLAIFVHGVFRVVLAFQLKPAPNWVWVLVSGIVGIILGILIWNRWPMNANWVLGLLLGINLFFDGMWIIMTSLAARSSLGALQGE